MASSSSSIRIVLRSIGTVAAVAGLFSPAYFEYVHINATSYLNKKDDETEVKHKGSTTATSTGVSLIATSSRFTQHFENSTSKVSVISCQQLRTGFYTWIMPRLKPDHLEKSMVYWCWKCNSFSLIISFVEPKCDCRVCWNYVFLSYALCQSILFCYLFTLIWWEFVTLFTFLVRKCTWLKENSPLLNRHW